MTDEDYDKIIEELEAELAEYKHVASAIDTQWAESQDEIADLKAQLAKALKGLEIYERERNRYKHAHPEVTGAYFLAGGIGEIDDNYLPQFVEIVPAYGCGWSQVYEKTDKTISYEGS